MPYYLVEREYKVFERVLVSAKDRSEAFFKAADDINCHITEEHSSDYEPRANTIAETAYVSEATQRIIEPERFK